MSINFINRSRPPARIWSLLSDRHLSRIVGTRSAMYGDDASGATSSTRATHSIPADAILKLLDLSQSLSA